MNNKVLGRPTGPSDGRKDRPWDPEQLSYKEKIALKYVAANPDMYRWKIAEKIKISGSRLSVLSCSKAGVEYLDILKNKPEGYLRPFKLTDE